MQYNNLNLAYMQILDILKYRKRMVQQINIGLPMTSRHR